MQFVVVGGAGFIGSHIVEALLQQHHHILVVDNLTSGQVNNLPSHENLKFISKSILDCRPEDFHKITPSIDGLVHLAAIPSVPASWQTPLAAHHSNLSTTVAVLELCQKLSIPRLVFASSAAVYGDQGSQSVAETQPPTPLTPYGLQKWMSEEYIRLFAPSLGLSAIALRIFNAYGPRQLATSPYSGVISIFAERMRNGLPITLYGDGQQSRDFIYVKDVASAFAQALILPLPEGQFEVCNLGTGQPTTLLGLLKALQIILPDWESDIQHEPVRKGDIKYSQANVSKLQQTLAFQASWSITNGLDQLLST